jgi:hypothetical protein
MCTNRLEHTGIGAIGTCLPKDTGDSRAVIASQLIYPVAYSPTYCI